MAKDKAWQIANDPEGAYNDLWLLAKGLETKHLYKGDKLDELSQNLQDLKNQYEKFRAEPNIRAQKLAHQWMRTIEASIQLLQVKLLLENPTAAFESIRAKESHEERSAETIELGKLITEFKDSESNGYRRFLIEKDRKGIKPEVMKGKIQRMESTHKQYTDIFTKEQINANKTKLAEQRYSELKSIYFDLREVNSKLEDPSITNKSGALKEYDKLIVKYENLKNRPVPLNLKEQREGMSRIITDEINRVKAYKEQHPNTPEKENRKTAAPVSGRQSSVRMSAHRGSTQVTSEVKKRESTGNPLIEALMSSRRDSRKAVVSEQPEPTAHTHTRSGGRGQV